MTMMIDRINGLNEGVAMKATCRLFSITNLPLYGLAPFEGKTPVADDRILVTGQTNAAENGPYIAAVGAWSRAPDFDGARDAIRGTLVQTYDAAQVGLTMWRVTTPNPIVVGAGNINFEQVVFPANQRGPFSNNNIFLSQDGLLLVTPDLPVGGDGKDNIAIGNGAMALTTSGNATIAVGTNAGNSFGSNLDPVFGASGRASAFLGFSAGRYVGAVSSWTVTGAFAAQGFETDPATGLNISGTHAAYGPDVCAYGEACLIHIIGGAKNNNAFGFNAGFGLTYASSNNIFGTGAGFAIIGIDGDLTAESQNSYFGNITGQYDRGRQNSAFGANAAAGTRFLAVNTGSTVVGGFTVALDDVTNFQVGAAIYQGGTIPMNAHVTAVTAASGPGTVTFDKAVFNAIPPGFTWTSLPSQHTGSGISALGFNAISGISAGASYTIGIGNTAGAGNIIGNDDIFIGRNTAASLTGGTGGNFIVGPLADVSSPTASNTMNLCNSIFGTGINSNTNTAKIGIEIVNPATTLDVGGSFSINSNVVVDTNRIIQERSYTVATLPTPSTAGRRVFASNGRCFNGVGTLEGAGVGTGVSVTDSGTAWKITGTNVTVSA